MQATGKRLIQYVGSVAFSDIKNLKHREAVKTFCAKVEEEDPRVKKPEIKGSEPHKSHDLPDDPQDVISVRLKDENDSRLGTSHVHEDGTSKTKWKK